MRPGWLWPALRRASLRDDLRKECDAIPNDLLERVVPQILDLIKYEKHIEEVRQRPTEPNTKTRYV